MREDNYDIDWESDDEDDWEDEIYNDQEVVYGFGIWFIYGGS